MMSMREKKSLGSSRASMGDLDEVRIMEGEGILKVK